MGFSLFPVLYSDCTLSSKAQDVSGIVPECLQSQLLSSTLNYSLLIPKAILEI